MDSSQDMDFDSELESVQRMVRNLEETIDKNEKRKLKEMRDQAKKLNFRCPYCAKKTKKSKARKELPKFTDIRVYVKHYIADHQRFDIIRGVRKFKWECKLCEQTFASRDIFVSHVKQSLCFHPVPPRPYQCSHCDRKFKRPSHLEKHMEGMHTTIWATLRQIKRNVAGGGDDDNDNDSSSGSSSGSSSDSSDDSSSDSSIMSISSDDEEE